MLLSLGAVLVGFFLNFSLEEKILATVESQLDKNAPCHLRYDGSKVFYFFPGVQFKNVIIPPDCGHYFSKPLNLKYLNIQIRGFNFSTFSPTISFKAEENKNFILNGKFSYRGRRDFYFHLKDTQMNAHFLSKLIQGFQGQGSLFNFPFNGHINIDAEMARKKGKFHNLLFTIQSRDLMIPKFAVMGVELPSINVGNVQISAQTVEEGKKLNLNKVSFGAPNRSLMADIEGHMEPNFKNFLKSKIKAKVKFKMADDLSNNPSISLLKMYLKKFYRPKDQFYHLELNNTLDNLDIK